MDSGPSIQHQLRAFTASLHPKPFNVSNALFGSVFFFMEAVIRQQLYLLSGPWRLASHLPYLLVFMVVAHYSGMKLLAPDPATPFAKPRSRGWTVEEEGTMLRMCAKNKGVERFSEIANTSLEFGSRQSFIQIGSGQTCKPSFRRTSPL